MGYMLIFHFISYFLFYRIKLLLLKNRFTMYNFNLNLIYFCLGLWKWICCKEEKPMFYGKSLHFFFILIKCRILNTLADAKDATNVEIQAIQCNNKFTSYVQHFANKTRQHSTTKHADAHAKVMDVDMDSAAEPYAHRSQLPSLDLVLYHLNMVFHLAQEPVRLRDAVMIMSPVDDAVDRKHLFPFVRVLSCSDDFGTKFLLELVSNEFGWPNALVQAPINIAAGGIVAPIRMFDALRRERVVCVSFACPNRNRCHFVAVSTYHRQDHPHHQCHRFHPYFRFRCDHDHFVIDDRTWPTVKHLAIVAVVYLMNWLNAVMNSFRLACKILQMLLVTCCLDWLVVGLLHIFNETNKMHFIREKNPNKWKCDII